MFMINDTTANSHKLKPTLNVPALCSPACGGWRRERRESTCRCMFKAAECSNSRAHGRQLVHLHLQMKKWGPREVESGVRTVSQISLAVFYGLDSGIIAKCEVTVTQHSANLGVWAQKILESSLEYRTPVVSTLTLSFRAGGFFGVRRGALFPERCFYCHISPTPGTYLSPAWITPLPHPKEPREQRRFLH